MVFLRQIFEGGRFQKGGFGAGSFLSQKFEGGRFVSVTYPADAPDPPTDGFIPIFHLTGLV